MQLIAVYELKENNGKVVETNTWAPNRISCNKLFHCVAESKWNATTIANTLVFIMVMRRRFVWHSMQFYDISESWLRNGYSSETERPIIHYFCHDIETSVLQSKKCNEESIREKNSIRFRANDSCRIQHQFVAIISCTDPFCVLSHSIGLLSSNIHHSRVFECVSLICIRTLCNNNNTKHTLKIHWFPPES